MEAIEPPGIPELQSRLYEVEFRENYKTPSFVEEDAVSLIRGNRGTILSGYFRLLAEEVLPRMAGGERKKQVAIFRSGWPNHSKARTNSYLAILWLILDAITKHRPLGNGPSSAGEASRWIERQDRLAAVGRSEGSVLLMYLNQLLEDLRRGRQDRYTLQKIIKAAGGEAIGFEASHQQLLSNFKTLARDRGLTFPYDGIRQLAARLNGELGLLAKHGWSRELSRTIRGTKYYLFRVDSS